MEKEVDLKLDVLSKETHGYHNKLFDQGWILKDLESFSEMFRNKLSVYIQHFGEKRKAKIPHNVPAFNYIQIMLDDQRCHVCDREAPRNSLAWKFMQQKAYEGENQEKQSKTFEDEFQRLFQKSVKTTGRYADLVESRLKADDLIEKNESEIIDLKKGIEKENERKNRLINACGGINAKETQSTHSVLTDRITNNKVHREKCVKAIAQKKENLELIENRIKSITEKMNPSKEISEKKQKLELLLQIMNIAIETRKRVFEELIKKLEHRSNQLYSTITNGNRAVLGTIKFVSTGTSSYQPKIFTDTGTELTSLNESNMLLVKLSVIMAVSSSRVLSKHFSGLNTLIADAPMSAFGDTYILGFCDVLSRAYPQSIITSKELFSDEKLLEKVRCMPDIKIGKIIKIEPSPGAERKNRKKMKITATVIS